MKGLFVLLYGLAFALVGAVWGHKRWRLFRDGIRTTGTVVELSIGMGIPKSYHPVVEFKTDAGRAIRFRGSTGTESSSPYREGQVVEVIYSRADPSHAQIANFEQLWLGPVAFGIFGLVTLGVFLRFFVF